MASNLLINQHLLLGKAVSQVPSTNHGNHFSTDNQLPDTVIIHYTAGSSLDSAVTTMCDPNNRVSAHIVVGRNGEMVQLVPFNHVAWHAGKSEWRGRTGLNQYSIGIEIDNAGPLSMNDDGQYLSWFNRAYSGQSIFKGIHRNETEPSYWHAYTEPQIRAVFSLCQTLIHVYPIKHVLGHEEVSPGRKRDPGPAFPLDKLRSTLLDSRDSNEAPSHDGAVLNRRVVTAPKLNIRGGAGVQYPAIGAPLLGGTAVKVLERKDGWVKVEQSVTGWVSSRYLK
ncbi:N-acetylmuramoyl-L-alanine amidase [Alteromonas oceanisediminis]|uniref:N-acetylmuramoyl-L-alanine amidase n=1 Tax=Alteromonas oceanisediminis TaxID=2836180 RepID=UPI0028F41B8C|nr:N-acetylmuramoyl-L-alanine amidase [Alteromonas oceanisediminis]